MRAFILLPLILAACASSPEPADGYRGIRSVSIRALGME
jgi:hypothetical protein